MSQFKPKPGSPVWVAIDLTGKKEPMQLLYKTDLFEKQGWVPYATYLDCLNAIATESGKVRLQADRERKQEKVMAAPPSDSVKSVQPLLLSHEMWTPSDAEFCPVLDRMMQMADDMLDEIETNAGWEPEMGDFVWHWNVDKSRPERQEVQDVERGFVYCDSMDLEVWRI